MDGEGAEEICRLLKKGGCMSVHIGGGEPFLDFEGLIKVIRKLSGTDIALDYIETNAFWAASDRKTVSERLNRLLDEGADTLCISVDPFHAEYVPYGAALALADLCEKTGMRYFLWKREFLAALSRLDSHRAHSREDMEKILSQKYIYNTARLYGIGYGGRAVNIEREFADNSTPDGRKSFGPFKPAEVFLAQSRPCVNLLSTGHFHVDMMGRFIPPRCTGICIPLKEAVEGIPPLRYPAFQALYSGGVSALMDLARNQGFIEDEAGYTSLCGLCFSIRHYLSGKSFPELDSNHYEEALKYYT